MHLKQIKQKVPKNRTNEKDSSNNKLKKNKITKESIEFKKIYILSPTINIANKQCNIFEPLKTDLPPKKSIKIINCNKENLKNEDMISNMEKIKVRINSIKTKNKNIIDSEKNNKTIKYTIKKILPQEIKKNKNIIFNYSCLDNIINKNNINKSEILYSTKNNFESPKLNILQNNKNQSYGNYYNKFYERNENLTSNNNYLNNTKKDIYRYNEIKNDKILYRNKKYNHLKRSNDILNDNIKNMKFSDIRSTSPLDSERYINKTCLTKNLKNSNSFQKLIEKSNLKLVKNNIRNKNINSNSLFSPKYNKIQNTYQKKLIKKHFIKVDNNDYDNNTFKFDNSIIIEKSKNDKSENKIDINNISDNQNNNFNSPKKNISSNNLSIFGLFNSKIKNENENENIKSNTIIIKNKIKSTIYNKNKNLYNFFNYNKEKEKEIINNKCESEQNLISENNYSTSNSFYHIHRNISYSSTNQKLLSSIKLEHKLKNIITSIDYNKTNSNNSKIKNKNVILYEYDKEGKLNYKIREMKNSVEKIIRENSNSKIKINNKIVETSPKSNKKGMISLYVKKNQGTILRKNKNKNRIEFYNPSLNTKI